MENYQRSNTKFIRDEWHKSQQWHKSQYIKAKNAHIKTHHSAISKHQGK